MARNDLFVRSPLTKAERWEVFKGFRAICQWTEVYYAWRPNLPDEADNHLIELAVAGRASAIVNGKAIRGGRWRCLSEWINHPTSRECEGANHRQPDSE